MKKKYLLRFIDIKKTYLNCLKDCKNIIDIINTIEIILNNLDFYYEFNFISSNSYNKAVIYLSDRLIFIKEAYDL